MSENLIKIENAKKLADRVSEFNAYFATNKLFGSVPDGDVPADKLLDFLLTHSHMLEDVLEIKYLLGKS